MDCPWIQIAEATTFVSSPRALFCLRVLLSDLFHLLFDFGEDCI